jgi:hypothetical protein
MNDKLQQQNNNGKEKEKVRPPYRWDRELEDITERAREVIEKEENVEENSK